MTAGTGWREFSGGEKSLWISMAVPAVRLANPVLCVYSGASKFYTGDSDETCLETAGLSRRLDFSVSGGRVYQDVQV